MCVKGPQGACHRKIQRAPMPRGHPSLVSVSGTHGWCRSHRGPTSLVQLPAQERAVRGDRDHWLVALQTDPRTKACGEHFPRGHSNGLWPGLSGSRRHLDSYPGLPPTAPTSHQGVVLLELGPVAAEELGQGGLAHCWVPCADRAQDRPHSHPDLTRGPPAPERWSGHQTLEFSEKVYLILAGTALRSLAGPWVQETHFQHPGRPEPQFSQPTPASQRWPRR